MREHKYRAWADGEMHYPSVVDSDWWYLGAEGYWSLNSGLDGSIICDSLESANPNLMERTGLNDKNGKEICEGDIVSVYWLAELGYTEKDCYATGQVVNDDCSFTVKFDTTFRVSVGEDGEYEEEFIGLTKHSHNDEVGLEFEVLGNIFENPELVKP